jgi:hypothetical protein
MNIQDETGSRPAVAVIGFDQRVSEEVGFLVERVERFASMVDFHASDDRFDIAVVEGSIDIDDDGLFVLIAGDSIYDGHDGFTRVSSLPPIEANEIGVAPELPAAFTTAANGLCHQILSTHPWVAPLAVADPDVARPLVTIGESVVAAFYDRGAAIGLAIPGDADITEWFRAFVEHLNSIDPIVVPVLPPKVARPTDWRTAHEVEAYAQLHRIEQEIAELRAWRAEAIASLSAAARDAEIGERWMLWATDDDLVGSVRMALEEIGFTVAEVDMAGREHLHVTASELGDWLALVDVAAFEGAPTAADLRKVNQHRMSFIAEHSTQPDQAWWVANDHHGLDPSRRPRTLDELADAATLVDVIAVSTRDLFTLGRDVAMQKVDAEKARLMFSETSPGVFRYEPTA